LDRLILRVRCGVKIEVRSLCSWCQEMRSGLWPGRIFFFLVVLLGFFAGPKPVWARPADSILDFMHLGSRPALGLGGDPFLSPSLKQTGWWRQEILDEDPEVQLKNYQFLPVTRRLSAGDSELELAYTQLGGRYSVEGRGRQLSLGLSVTSIRASAAVDGDLSSVNLAENGTSVGALARLEDLLPGLDVQLALPLGQSSKRNSGDGLFFGAHYCFRDRLQLASHWSRWDTQEAIVAVLDDETVSSPLNLDVDTFHHQGRLDLPLGFSLEARISESNYQPQHALMDDGYDFQPEAWSMNRQQSLEWVRNDRLRLLARHSDVQLQADGAGFWGGQRYLRLSHTQARMESFLGAIQVSLGSGRRVFMDVEFGDYDAFARMDVDSWRFASWEQAWSGAKKIIQLDGTGTWERYHLAYQGPWGAWSVGGGLSYYDIYPDAFSESWIHIPFLRPQEYEKSVLASPRISLGAVSLQAERWLGNVFLSAELHQFVYGNDHPGEIADQDEPAPPAPPPGPAPGGWFGGTYASFSVGYSF
jgi:hypothetical protein